LIRSVFGCQSLKDEPFETFTAASETEIERFWKTILLVDDSVIHEDRTAEYIKRRVSKMIFEWIIIQKKKKKNKKKKNLKRLKKKKKKKKLKKHIFV